MNFRFAFLAALVVVLPGIADPDDTPSKISFPKDFRAGILYNIVDREDQGEVHEQYTSAEAIEAAKAGKPLPYGTIVVSANSKARRDSQGQLMRDPKGNFMAGELDRVAVMEKRSGWGSEYSDNIRNGEWEFALFTPDGKPNPMVPVPVCMACHKPHEHLDYIKTYFAMAGKRVEASPTPIPSSASVATISHFSVRPARIAVQRGVPVAWVNADEVAHQFLVRGVGVKTGYFLKGGTGTVIISQPGTYSYEDTFYPNVESLKGVIEVR